MSIEDQRREKMQAIRSAVMNAAFEVANIMADRHPYERLLLKRPFPDRSMPKRKRRGMKKQALAHHLLQRTRLMLHMASSAAQVRAIAQQPVPSYPSGGYISK